MRAMSEIAAPGKDENFRQTPFTERVLWLLFALAVTASVQLVGVYLVFSCLIVPALATRNFKGFRRLWYAYGLGAGAFALGLAISAIADWPSGAVVVLVMAILAVLFAMVTSRTGLVSHAKVT